LSERLDSTNKIGLGLILGSFTVSRIDKQEMKADMERMRNETKTDMETMRNETRFFNIFTLLVAISAIVLPIYNNKN